MRTVATIPFNSLAAIARSSTRVVGATLGDILTKHVGFRSAAAHRSSLPRAVQQNFRVMVYRR